MNESKPTDVNEKSPKELWEEVRREIRFAGVDALMSVLYVGLSVKYTQPSEIECALTDVKLAIISSKAAIKLAKKAINERNSAANSSCLQLETQSTKRMPPMLTP